jgi:hypothetical protein
MLGRTVKLLRGKFIPYCRMHGIPYRYFDINGIRPAYARAIHAWSELEGRGSVPADQAYDIYTLLPKDSHGNPGVAPGFKARLKRMADQEDPPQLTRLELKNEYGLLAEGTWDQVFTEISPLDMQYIQRVLNNGHSLLDKPHVHISTIHRVKGGQADTVILLSDTSRGIENRFEANQDEETRVFYTGITRTYEDLIVVQPSGRYYEGLFA